jgi:antitoxin ParD1/3/4
MPTRNINLTDYQDRYVAEALASGRYQNASEVVRASLRLLERREREDEVRLARLRGAIDEADQALAEGDFEDVDSLNVAAWLAGVAGEADT